VVQLKESRPEPIYIGLHSWTLGLRSNSNEPILNALVKAEPMMLDHGHGTTPPFTVARESGSTSGEYVISDLDLFMPGLWTIFVTVETNSGLTDTVVFEFVLRADR
jgi:hypothetical protein